MKRIISFLDKHRIFLALIIILVISLTFIAINSFLFFHHKFKSLTCTDELEDIYCYNNDIQIFKNPNQEKEKIFKEKSEEINNLTQKYKLPKFNFYTSYYYEVAALFNFNETNEGEDLLLFFKYYNNSYSISEFYKNNTFYYEMFYPYKII